ncbi:DUF3108 domain-containing protein [Nitrincola alkalilacustris]|uniref:DUF3108 domain-containing protein n=1 Tax=Nitrincola alkalilacustris TaxID=1571224 RepID=UPI00124E223D|nr:DUF3108 domain-containing protein [Nitrincola alkalilacustris]
MKKAVTLATLMLTLLGSKTSAIAEELSLTPYKAIYSNEMDVGISFTGEATRELKQLADGTWQLSIEASAMFASVREVSQFTVEEDFLKPLKYDYQRRVMGKRREASLSFDWENESVTTDIENQPWRMTITPGVQDKLSYQLQMRMDLAAGKEELIYEVADGGKLQEYRFRVIGEEVIDTPLGQLKSIKVERDRGEGSNRETYIWFAPELDYMVIRIHQVETDGKNYLLFLKSLEQ